jgi:serine protease Do
MGFRFKSMYAVAIVAVLIVAQSAIAQRGRSQTDNAGWLGVSIQDVTEDLRDALPRNIDDGALINHVVSGSPAEAAGLEEGDVVVRVDRERIADSDDLTRIIREAGSGASVRVEYYRSGRSRTATIELKSARNSEARDTIKRFDRGSRRAPEHRGSNNHGDLKFFGADNWSEEWPMLFGGTKPRLGVRMMDMGDQFADYFKVTDAKGALITEVLDDSPAKAAGIKAGDVITGLDDREVESSDDLRKVLSNLDEGGDIKVELVRNGRSQTLTVALEEMEQRGFRAMRMPGTRVRPFPMPGAGGDEWRSDMKDLRQELMELREELKDLRSDLR